MNQQVEKRGSDLKNGQSRAGKYLTFVLADESYGLEILKVREIMGLLSITPVPKTPAYVKGVINLRGHVIPVIDLRVKFGLEEAKHTDETCIIVIDVNSMHTGIIVDTVDEVLDISEDDIEDAPNFGHQVNSDYILGIAKSGGHVKILLDVVNVLEEDGQILQKVSDKDGRSVDEHA